MSTVFTMSTLLGAAALFAAASVSHGAVLAQYQFNDNPATSSDTDPNSTAGNFTPNGLAAISTSSGSAFVRSNATGPTAADAAADLDFFSFTVTGENGQLLNLSSLTLDLGASNNYTTGGPETFSNTLYVTSGDLTIGTATSSVQNTNGVPTYPTNASFDLTGAQYQGLASITFRLAFSDNVDNDGASINRLDNVVLNGTTAAAVPEPTLLALAPLTLAAMLRRRR